MADTEEPQFNTLAERIAALNKQKNFNSAEPAKKKKPPPPPPPGPKRTDTSSSIISNGSAVALRPSGGNAPPPLPRRDTQTNTNGDAKAIPPPLPGRMPSHQATPPLPRRTSTQSTLTPRRNSASSDMSQLSNMSSLSLGRTTSSSTTSYSSSAGPRKMAPAICDPASLPVLPPSKREAEARAKAAAVEDAAASAVAFKEARERQLVKQAFKAQMQAQEQQAQEQQAQEQQALEQAEPQAKPAAVRPSLPPRLPSRPVKPAQTDTAEKRPALAPRMPSRPVKSAPPQTEAVKEPPAPAPAQRKLPYGNIRGFGSGKTETPDRPNLPTRPSQSADNAPPPVPLTSRPSAAQIDAFSTRKTQATNADPNNCWICRDWSRPDAVAAQFPRETLPRNDPVGYLARNLCEQFPSYDDKARAIFTWFHHNIAYDTVSFFGNCVKGQKADETIFSGLAVCSGYAETYKTIANRAGLECIVVTGHGKGIGYTAPKNGERCPPPDPTGHAWNAVRIDGGGWKLLDACWGAGNVDSATQSYNKNFKPHQFIASNEILGTRHFPEKAAHQFRSDGRPITWEQYITGGLDGEKCTIYSNTAEEGVADDTIEPKLRDVSVHSGQVVRFQYAKVCEHWTSEKNGKGKPSLFFLLIQGLDGRKKDFVMMQSNGYWAWADVNARDLGAPGQTVSLGKLDTFDNRDARGVTAAQFLEKKGRVGMSYSYLAQWQLV